MTLIRHDSSCFTPTERVWTLIHYSTLRGNLGPNILQLVFLILRILVGLRSISITPRPFFKFIVMNILSNLQIGFEAVCASVLVMVFVLSVGGGYKMNGFKSSVVVGSCLVSARFGEGVVINEFKGVEVVTAVGFV